MGDCVSLNCGNNTGNSCLSINNINPASALKVTTCVFAILFILSTFAIAGQFFPAGGLAFIPLPPAIIVAIVSFVATAVSAFFAYRANQTVYGQASKRVDPELFEALKTVEERLNGSLDERAFKMVRRSLGYEPMLFNNQYDYYTFHYCLTAITDALKEQGLALDEWKGFLQKIDGMQVTYRCDGRHLTIDCSGHLDRLARKEIEFEIEELDLENLDARDLEGITEICAEGFSGIPADVDMKFYIRNYANRCFVVRDKDSRQIMGVIMGEEKELRSGKKSGFIHTFARRANTARIGLTNYIEAEFLKIFKVADYERIECQVDKQNSVARGLYEKLGFEIVPQGLSGWFSKAYLMRYNPKLRLPNHQ